ncbi:tail fiber assembly protein [Pseudomonas lactis]|uniref:tail fiber assembly protein n=1 Tax=Pseudomonas lactis TaxID=1615674 RepID=UPI00345D34E8
MVQETVNPADLTSTGGHVPVIEKIQRRSDGSFVIAYDGYPYHATKVETPDVYERVLAEIEGGAVVNDYVEPVAPKPDPLAEAVAEYNRLRGIADFTIAPLQDAVEEGDATEAEAALLKIWKKYRVALSRVSEQQDYPQNVVWPAAPESART